LPIRAQPSQSANMLPMIMHRKQDRDRQKRKC
uniref:DUF3362 domain-containing protein n=1 Tax=Gongylonema pulchrum TaxID=637853 RepID=A0A183E9Q5_9BILA